LISGSSKPETSNPPNPASMLANFQESIRNTEVINLWLFSAFVSLVAAWLGIFAHRQKRQYQIELNTREKQFAALAEKMNVIQEQLKKREEGYRAFIDQSAVGIWRAEYQQPIPTDISIDEQIELLLATGHISECNESMAKMYGYDNPHQLLGRRIKDFYYIENKFDEQKTRELLTTFIINNYRIRNEESKKTDHHGNVLYILNNNIGIVENGFLLRTWGVQTDITDRKKIERELQETNRELDIFFYKASHDLKGPLASIRGIINLARMEEKRSGETEKRRAGEAFAPSPLLPVPDSFFKITGNYFGLIEGSVKRLDSTLMDLIELARTRQGVSKLTAINIKSMTEEILESLSNVGCHDKIRFEIHIDSSIELVADKVLLQSVFQNLIHNAINYCNDKNPGILIHVRETGDGIELEITDNGKGIAENIRHKVFDMFYRGHPDSGGSGLGLFIVKNALEKMKGKIRFESEEGKGTTFFVDIPNALVEA
jgi:PAS domain S-box-containing protein